MHPSDRASALSLCHHHADKEKVSDFPADYPPYQEKRRDGQLDHIVNRGGSCICGPLGTIIAGPVWDKGQILYATLDMEDLIEARVCISLQLAKGFRVSK